MIFVGFDVLGTPGCYAGEPSASLMGADFKQNSFLGEGGSLTKMIIYEKLNKTLLTKSDFCYVRMYHTI